MESIVKRVENALKNKKFESFSLNTRQDVNKLHVTKKRGYRVKSISDKHNEVLVYYR